MTVAERHSGSANPVKSVRLAIQLAAEQLRRIQADTDKFMDVELHLNDALRALGALEPEVSG